MYNRFCGWKRYSTDEDASDWHTTQTFQFEESSSIDISTHESKPNSNTKRNRPAQKNLILLAGKKTSNVNLCVFISNQEKNKIHQDNFMGKECKLGQKFFNLFFFDKEHQQLFPLGRFTQVDYFVSLLTHHAPITSSQAS